MDNPLHQLALRTRFAILALVLVAAAGTGEAAMSNAPTPSKVMHDTFVGCTWGKVKGAKLSVWSYACDAQHGDTRLIADYALPGFKLFPGGRVAIVAFTKPAEAPIEAILTQVRAASPGPHSDTCALVPIPGDHGRRQAYDLAPTGAAKVQWDAFETNPNPTTAVEPPCGFMGPGQVGDRYFEILRGHPEFVTFIDAASEIQIFDADTLKPR